MQDFSAFIEQLKEKNDITSVISGYVSLDRKGGKLWGRCPFHHEKTPSFTVNEEGQFYHCFGCGAGGDVIKFIQETESLPFIDAVKFLCEKSGLQMPNTMSGGEETDTKQKREKRDRLYAVLKDSARYYYNCLNESGAEVVKYLKNRGITEQYIKAFGLGYSPNSTGLIKHLSGKGHTSADIIAAGTAVKKDGKLFDPLGGRLIVPIINSLGDVIAFGGRDMQGTSLAKYKNTAETEVFTKSKQLYALNLVKKSRQYKKGIIVVEGYMDAIALHQAGFPYAVASMGTSLTKEQAKLIKRFTDDAIICYDGDNAGQAATIRGLDILYNAGLSVRVISMPENIDPDEYIKANGKQSFENLMEKAMPLSDFKIATLKKSYNINTPDGKRKYAAAAIKIIAAEKGEIVKEELLKQLRNITGLTYESLKRELEAEGQQPNMATTEQVADNTSATMNIKAARFIIYSLLKKKPYADIEDLPQEMLSSPSHIKILNYINECNKNNKPLRLSNLFEGEFESEVALTAEAGDEMSDFEQELYYRDCKKFFKTAKYENQLKILTAEFDTEKDNEKRKQLALKIQAIMIEQKKNI